ncbi:hypothetical protein OG912_13015 [Streptomyces sp. NBC_00464]|uniref:hypothetical protein n=1 Tax=Streptomyces sp. NBC_00464 TaxID=2975751 RepID=UPI002E17BC40
MAADGSRTIEFYWTCNGACGLAGSAHWQANGDTLIAKDVNADGWGIEARMSTGRVASTRGLSSPVTVKKTGDLTEGNWYNIQLCLVKGSDESCSDGWSVHA